MLNLFFLLSWIVFVVSHWVSLCTLIQCCHQTIPAVKPGVPDTSSLKETVTAFKDSLKVPAGKLQEIYKTEYQRRETVPFVVKVHWYRITASRLGEILCHKSETPPDTLVSSILQPCSFSTAATKWGIQSEPAYLTYRQQLGRDSLIVGPCGILVSETHPFLRATPYGKVYDPSNSEQPFGFIKAKCPYIQRECTPLEACSFPGCCCDAQLHLHMT